MLERSGPQWCTRYPTSVSLEDLSQPFQGNVVRFVGALRAAGASVTVNATYRPAERAYRAGERRGYDARLRAFRPTLGQRPAQRNSGLAPEQTEILKEGLMTKSKIDARLRAHVDQFKDMPDAKFIRAAISTARYLDRQSRAVAIEALRRFDLMHPEAK
jgi:hypothetical protein